MPLSPPLETLAAACRARGEALQASVRALTSDEVGLAEARRESSVCRDALLLLRSQIDAFDLAAAGEEAVGEEEEAAAAAAELRSLRLLHDSLRNTLRETTLAAFKRARDAASREREALLAGAVAKAGGGSGDAALLSASEEATASLRRTRALMAAELARGDATLAVQAGSNAQLRATHGELGQQKGALAAGRKSLKALNAAARADAAVLWAGSALFGLVVAHITLKRVPLLTPLHPLYQLRRWQAGPDGGGRGLGEGLVSPLRTGYEPPQAAEAEAVLSPPPPPPPLVPEAEAAAPELLLAPAPPAAEPGSEGGEAEAQPRNEL